MVSIPVIFMLINPRTCDGVLLLLYCTQDSVIQNDINNKSIPHAYDDQAYKHERNLIKYEIIKLNINI
jgi:hypothetical protein